MNAHAPYNDHLKAHRLAVIDLNCRHLRQIRLTADASECLAISGPSGTGKTLLLRAICDLEPHDGQMFLDGVDSSCIEPPVWRRSVGMLPAENFWWNERVGDHLNTVPDDWLNRLGFNRDVLDWSASRLSSGERQRLALIRLMENHPKVLLLDEPTANLDSTNRDRVEGMIRDYIAACGAAALWVSHDADQINRLSSRRFELKDGSLLEV